MEIDIEIDKKFAGCIKPKWLKGVVETTLTSQIDGSEAKVSIVITGQKRIHELNKAYLDEDRPTDVLSFPLMEPSDKAVFVTAPGSKKHLGDVIISFPQAVSQAEEHGHTVEKEIAVLVVHGLLHLLGHDHAKRPEKAEMQSREKEVLGLLGKAAE